VRGKETPPVEPVPAGENGERGAVREHEAFFTSEEPFAEKEGEKPNNFDTIRIDTVKTDVPKDFKEETGAPPQRRTQSAPVGKKQAVIKMREEAEKKRRRKKREHARTFTHIFGSVLLVVFIVSASAFIAQFIVRAALDFTGITTDVLEITVEIPEDALTEEIAGILKENGIIGMPDLFCFYSRVTKKDGGYLHGLFTLNSNMSYGQIIGALQNKTRISETVRIQIREGMTAREIGLLLEENRVCRAADFEIFYRMKINTFNFEKRVLQSTAKFNQLEGYLFPDTYDFYVADELAENSDTADYAEIAAKTIYANTQERITPEMYKKINEMGFTLDEFITLASMVQKEAGTVGDMYLVAAVFLNRLDNSDRFPYLQSDVTGLYARDDIKPYVNAQNAGIYEPIMEAYDSYVSAGLPPGPICNPGMAAMEAVLSAPDTNAKLSEEGKKYFYFCANVETLEMFYAETLYEHELNLERAGIA
jgi:UPF0755 protein